jgi:hypothetical protein
MQILNDLLAGTLVENEAEIQMIAVEAQGLDRGLPSRIKFSSFSKSEKRRVRADWIVSRPAFA